MKKSHLEISAFVLLALLLALNLKVYSQERTKDIQW